MGTSILPLLEVEIFEWCIKELKWYSSYLLNTSLKGLDHFILIHKYTNTRIHEYTNTQIDEYVYSNSNESLNH